MLTILPILCPLQMTRILFFLGKENPIFLTKFNFKQASFTPLSEEIPQKPN